MTNLILLFFVVSRGVVLLEKTYAHRTAKFGPAPGEYDLSAPTAFGNDGCDTIDENLVGKIALIERGGCYFVQKALEAQKAGAVGLIVGAISKNQQLVQMYAKNNGEEVYIPSVFVEYDTFQTILANPSQNVTMNQRGESELALFDAIEWQQLMKILVFLPCGFFLILILWAFVRQIKKLFAMFRRRSNARGLPIMKFDPHRVHNLSCPVCLEDFVEDERVKILQCGHSYHPQCIDAWIEQRDICPMCRERVVPTESTSFGPCTCCADLRRKFSTRSSQNQRRLLPEEEFAEVSDEAVNVAI